MRYRRVEPSYVGESAFFYIVKHEGTVIAAFVDYASALEYIPMRARLAGCKESNYSVVQIEEVS